jgi:hypothetical protein
LYFCLNNAINILLITLIPLNGFSDNLNTATGVGFSTTTDAGTYIDVASATVNIGANSSDIDKVLVVATYEVLAINKNAHKARFRLVDVANSAYSQILTRHLQHATDGDKGIGSLVYIFDVSGNSGNITFKLQHSTSNGSYNNTTSGTIVAIALGYQYLPYSIG